jgi:hypothetical protein
MDAYKEQQTKKFLASKNIKLEEETEEFKLKMQEEAKKKEMETKKQVYIQSQLMNIDESIKTFKTDKTDDNILMILTIIKDSIENLIKNGLNDTDKKPLCEELLKFSGDVDKHVKRPGQHPGAQANIQELKQIFQQVYKLVGIDVQIFNNAQPVPVANVPMVKPAQPIGAPVQPVVRQPAQPAQPVQPVVRQPAQPAQPVQPVVRQPAQPVVHAKPPEEDEEDDDIEDIIKRVRRDEEEFADDEAYARHLQDEWNNFNKKPEKIKKPVVSTSSMDENETCSEFIEKLYSQKIFGPSEAYYSP